MPAAGCQIEQRLREALGDVEIGFAQLAHERSSHRPKGPGELTDVEGTDQSVAERLGDLRRQPICALCVSRREFEPQAGESQDVVADPTEPVFRLPKSSAFERYPGVQNVVPGKADQVPWIERSGRTLHRVTEDNPKAPGTARTEVGGGDETQVDFQQLAEQERTVGRGAGMKVEMVYGAEFAVDERAPLAQRLLHRDAVRYSEEQIDIGPAIFGVSCR